MKQFVHENARELVRIGHERLLDHHASLPQVGGGMRRRAKNIHDCSSKLDANRTPGDARDGCGPRASAIVVIEPVHSWQPWPKCLPEDPPTRRFRIERNCPTPARLHSHSACSPARASAPALWWLSVR